MGQGGERLGLFLKTSPKTPHSSSNESQACGPVRRPGPWNAMVAAIGSVGSRNRRARGDAHSAFQGKRPRLDLKSGRSSESHKNLSGYNLQLQALVCQGLFHSDLRERSAGKQLGSPIHSRASGQQSPPPPDQQTRSRPRHSEGLGPPSPGEPWLNSQCPRSAVLPGELGVLSVLLERGGGGSYTLTLPQVRPCPAPPFHRRN